MRETGPEQQSLLAVSVTTSGGVDGESIGDFQGEAGKRLAALGEQLRSDEYEPMAIRRVYIPKLGSHELRPLGIPTIRDRVVQTALRSVIEPMFENDFSDNSYGFRPKRSTKDALRSVSLMLAEGRGWVVDVDIERYFDTIPHEQLMKEIEKKIADGRVLAPKADGPMRRKVPRGQVPKSDVFFDPTGDLPR